MKPKAHAPAIALAALILAGCGGGSGGDQPVASAPPPPPALTSTTTAFTPFVKQQLAMGAAAEPASVNEQEWTFDEDGTAYDDVIQAAGT